MSSQPIQCQKCGNFNLPSLYNCIRCGNAIQLKKSSLSPRGVLAIIAGSVFLAILLGLMQFAENKNKEARSAINSPTTEPVRFTANASPVYNASPANNKIASLANTNTTNTAKKLVSKSKTATVISENANLRSTPDSAGEILQELPEESELEIIKQKSAWFQVKFNNQIGWVHGNTIKLSDGDTTPVPDMTPTYRSTPSKVYQAPVEKSNPSGATARCRDGSLSYSANRRGTCSHHGGVAEWF